VVGQDRLPTLEDVHHLPYIQAVIKECHRWRPVAPLGAPHASIEEINVRITRNIATLPDSWSQHSTMDSGSPPAPLSLSTYGVFPTILRSTSAQKTSGPIAGFCTTLAIKLATTIPMCGVVHGSEPADVFVRASTWLTIVWCVNALACCCCNGG
jgi:hypothetical protein